MLYPFPLVLTLSAVLSFPGWALAHGDEGHAAQAKSSVSKKSGHHGVPGAGHAAALGQPASLEQATRTLEIEMGDTMRFKPERLEIKQGETVRFVVRNLGQIKHEMVLGTMAELKEHAKLMARFPEMEHDDPNAVSVEPGKTGEYAWTFSKPGHFDFGCLVPGHFEAGMKGRIVVKK